MSRRILLLPLILALTAAGAAEAQYGGGGMGGGMGGGGMGGGGRHGGGRQKQDKTAPPAPAADQKPSSPRTPLSKVQISGTITRIDPATGRVTIAYEEVDALNWPAGTTPFAVEKPALLQGLSVGEKVRFHVESQQISAIEPVGPPASTPAP